MRTEGVRIKVPRDRQTLQLEVTKPEADEIELVPVAVGIADFGLHAGTLRHFTHIGLRWLRSRYRRPARTTATCGGSRF
jgi:hypothetical protein